MSWSMNKTGSQVELKQYLDEQAPQNISHVTGVARTLADSALGLMRATVEGTNDPAVKALVLSAYGSANHNNGKTSQAIKVQIFVQY